MTASYNNIKELTPGDSVTEENILKTDKASTAELLLNNSSVVRIKENSILQVTKLFKDNEKEKTEFKLEKGSSLFKPKEQTEGSSFEVKTGTVTVGVPCLSTYYK